jgi:phosphate transport system permease protein
MLFERKKKITQSLAFGLLQIASYIVVGILLLIIGFIFKNGISVISWDFLTKAPEEGMLQGGIFPAIIGTFYLVICSMIIAAPIGIMSGIYIQEYLKSKWARNLINQMTNNLAGVPSIIFGLFGMTMFVNKLGFGDSIIAGSLTLAILVLPVIIRATQESLKAIDNSLRDASLALGATKLQTTFKVVMPAAMGNIITGIILAIGRVSGETAPILFTVAAYFLPKLPTSIKDQVMALPYHLYVISTSGTDVAKARPIAYGTALVLITIVLMLNLTAAYIRFKINSKTSQKK